MKVAHIGLVTQRAILCHFAMPEQLKLPNSIGGAVAAGFYTGIHRSPQKFFSIHSYESNKGQLR
jgi:hypothetical protein